MCLRILGWVFLAAILGGVLGMRVAPVLGRYSLYCDPYIWHHQ